MNKKLENDIRKLSDIFAKHVEVTNNTPFEDISLTLIMRAEADMLECNKLQNNIATKLGITGADNQLVRIIDFTRNEGSDAAKPLERSLALLSAFQNNMQNEVSKRPQRYD